MQKVAIVYDRVNKWGGAERVLLALHEIFPKAPLYTSVYEPKKASWARVFPKIYTSFLQEFPLAKSNHEFLAPLMPVAFLSFNFSDYDLVISVTSEAAKGIRIRGKTKHICYCLTPTRYFWSGYNEYFKNLLFRIVSWPGVQLLKFWDKKTASWPDRMVAISTEVQKRIKKYYERGSEIIFPPVIMGKVKNLSSRFQKQNYYLLVSRLDYGYKKVDLAIKTFNQLDAPLVVVGIGREEKKLKKMAKGNIEFVGKVTEKELAIYYKNAKALIMPQEEDFGIVSVEAQAYGVPVIAYKKGGSLDTIISGKTGIFFNSQTPLSLKKAIKEFEHKKFSSNLIIKNSTRFSKTRFKKEVFDLVEKMLN